jgi:hypothetical protein
MSAKLCEFERRKSDLRDLAADFLTGDSRRRRDEGGTLLFCVAIAGCGVLGGVAGMLTMRGFIGETASEAPALLPRDPT